MVTHVFIDCTHTYGTLANTGIQRVVRSVLLHAVEAEKLVSRVRQFSDLPVAVGFGISKPEHVRDVWRYADAAVVGSAIVRAIEDAHGDAHLVEGIGALARALMKTDG